MRKSRRLHQPSENSQWAGFVKAHRLAQNLNQGEFADLMGVSQQTVSRWESGAQVPDAGIQERLRASIRATALGSLDFWKYRVSSSRGHELLIDRDLTVLAASQRASKLLGRNGPIDGANFAELFPETEILATNHSEMHSVSQFQQIGFFDGLIRSIRMDMEWHVELGSCFCKTDIWPVLTSEQTIIGHLTGAPVQTTKSADFQGVRVHEIDIRLNKES